MQLNTLSMVHEFLRRTVKPGDFCIDATAGKGRDTALLCRLTGDAGRVLAFDIQEAAMAQTKALLAAEGLTAEVIRDSHANMERYAAAETVDCVVSVSYTHLDVYKRQTAASCCSPARTPSGRSSCSRR